MSFRMFPRISCFMTTSLGAERTSSAAAALAELNDSETHHGPRSVCSDLFGGDDHPGGIVQTCASYPWKKFRSSGHLPANGHSGRSTSKTVRPSR